MKERKLIFDCNIFKVFCYFSFFMDILVLRLDVWNNLCLSFTMILWATFYFLGWFFFKGNRNTQLCNPGSATVSPTRRCLRERFPVSWNWLEDFFFLKKKLVGRLNKGNRRTRDWWRGGRSQRQSTRRLRWSSTHRPLAHRSPGASGRHPPATSGAASWFVSCAFSLKYPCFIGSGSAIPPRWL